MRAMPKSAALAPPRAYMAFVASMVPALRDLQLSPSMKGRYVAKLWSNMDHADKAMYRSGTQHCVAYSSNT